MVSLASTMAPPVLLLARGGMASTSSFRSSVGTAKPGVHVNRHRRRQRCRGSATTLTMSGSAPPTRGCEARPTHSAKQKQTASWDSGGVSARRRRLARGAVHRGGMNRPNAGAAGSSGGEPAGGGELDAAAAGEEVVAEIVMIDEGVGGEEEEWSFQWPSSLDDLSEKWTDLPSRYRIIVGTCCAFILCNMVNISVAIIPMAKDMGWSVGTAGVLQSAFFYGFALSQLPGGYLATRFGGARMLPLGVFVWSAATAAVPFVAEDTKALFVSRVLVGLGEGISPAAATDVIARSVPLSERSRAVAFVFNGFNIGSVLGLSASPFIIEAFGWKTVFLVFGAAGVAWVQWVGLGIYGRGGAMPDAPADAVGPTAAVTGLTGKRVMREIPHADNDENAAAAAAGGEAKSDIVDAIGEVPWVSNEEARGGEETADAAADAAVSGSGAGVENAVGKEDVDDDPPVPWGEILRSTPLRALSYVHFCNNWGFYVLLAWLPSYFTQELDVNLTNASLFTLLPPLANIGVASFVGPLADNAIERGVVVSTVRKSAQAIAFLGPATFMGAACLQDSPVATVGLLTVGLSLASFSYAGLYCNHQDMSPRFASILLGITNTMGAFPGVIGVPLTGYLLERTDNWEVSMFLPAVFFYVTGAAVFAKYGSADKQPWG